MIWTIYKFESRINSKCYIGITRQHFCVKPSPECIKKSADARRGVKRSEEFKQACRERAAKQFSNPVQRAKISETMKLKWANPEYRQMIMDSRIGGTL